MHTQWTKIDFYNLCTIQSEVVDGTREKARLYLTGEEEVELEKSD